VERASCQFIRIVEQMKLNLLVERASCPFIRIVEQMKLNLLVERASCPFIRIVEQMKITFCTNISNRLEARSTNNKLFTEADFYTSTFIKDKNHGIHYNI